jgi:hypothetical protein
MSSNSFEYLKGNAAMITEAQHLTMTSPQGTTAFLRRMVGHVRQFICGLHGHDALLRFGQGRLSLQCASCGYETPGWDVRGTPARTITSPKARVVQMPLVRQRRVA